MSNVTYTGNEAVAGFVPAAMYQGRILEAKFGPSKKGEPMVTLEIEIVAPDKVVHAGIEYLTAGSKTTTYLSFSPKAKGRSFQNLKTLGLTLTPGESLDTIGARAVSGLPNTVFTAKFSSETQYARQDLTPAQVAAGLRPYDAEILMEDGQPVIEGYRTQVSLNNIKNVSKL